MSFVFASPAGPRTATVAPSSFWDRPALLLAIALSVTAMALVVFGSDKLSYAILFSLGLPVALIIVRTRKMAERASSQRVAATRQRYWAPHRAALLKVGDRMLARSRRDRQPLSVVVFDEGHLPELGSLFGPEMAERMVAKLAKTLQGMATRKGLVIRTEATALTVLLPGFDGDRALAAVRQALGATGSIDFDADGEEIVLVPDFLVRTLYSDSSSIQEICEAMRRDITRSQQQERRRKLSLQRERESYLSRSAPLMQADGRPTAAACP